MIVSTRPSERSWETARFKGASPHLPAAYATDVSVDASRLRVYVESLRLFGQVSEEFESDEAADEWRAAIRRACRGIKTFRLRQNSDEGALRVTLFVLDKDHVVTLAQKVASVEALPVPPTWQRVDQADAGGLRPDRAEALSPSLAATSDVEQAAEAVERAAGKPARRRRGQGFQLDQEVKVAVEVRAINAATEVHAASWDVEDVHDKESYDLRCRRGDEEKHVEVKGTTTDGVEVVLTPNEVSHARENRHTALFILSDVRVERADDGTVTATGGIRHVRDPWNIDEAS